MKCGTTSLSADLAQHPGVYVPAVKEPHFLCMRRESQARVRELYATLFERARPGQLRVDGSTGYSKRPTVEGVAERALQLGGRDLRILYVVRDPVKRALSHHYHLYREGRAPADFGEALRKYPELIDYGRYAWQLEPWIEAFGLSRILVVRFEDYVGGRAQVSGPRVRLPGRGCPAAVWISACRERRGGEYDRAPSRSQVAGKRQASALVQALRSALPTGRVASCLLLRGAHRSAVAPGCPDCGPAGRVACRVRGGHPTAQRLRRLTGSALADRGRVFIMMSARAQAADFLVGGLR
jgi:hypothetical protein